jgi:hypothetical protein
VEKSTIREKIMSAKTESTNAQYRGAYGVLTINMDLDSLRTVAKCSSWTCCKTVILLIVITRLIYFSPTKNLLRERIHWSGDNKRSNREKRLSRRRLTIRTSSLSESGAIISVGHRNSINAMFRSSMITFVELHNPTEEYAR